ncbi:hypothetical protein NUU61_004941 [Penicillium alfredii]|uniref:Uncharacterized protein n=1 Tax=Penicillium alfredii TaxID=1506179 RepID=A0A9W9F8H3_9EURO|nr:uncharacterized protein NUU61_004941 [Penicillium alfredii]KAJ5095585.1 hypothetical protein NUU61_004941 [Penicillium alfredii]
MHAPGFSYLAQVNIHEPPSDENNRILKTELLPALWNLPPKNPAEASDAFLEYYMNQRIVIEAHGLNIKTHQDLMDLTNCVKSNAHLTRTRLVAHLDEHCGWAGPAIHAIEVVLRIWLFISIDDWDPTQTLEQYLRASFPSTEDFPSNTPSFPLGFNGFSLKEIGGFDIAWTECLHDHLSFAIDGTQKQLKIFHLSSFLQGYRHSRDREILPPAFFEETARTISLLFPTSNLKCQRWVRKARTQQDLDLDPGFLPATSRDLSQFPYWGRQLLELRDEYDRTEPTTVRQWVIDKRKPNQRYTFWIAVVALFLALVFGLIQSVTGIIQAIKS